MARLKKLDDAQIFKKRYAAKRVIYVESKEDIRILYEHWFSDKGDKVEFRL